MPNRDVYTARTVHIRDFSGGWNVADNDQNLSSKYQPLSDNVTVGVDNAISPRLGFERFANLKGPGDETTYTVTATSFTYSVTSGSSKVRIILTGGTWHGFFAPSQIKHVTINTFPVSPLGGIPVSDFYGTKGIVLISPTEIEISVRTASNATATSAAIPYTANGFVSDIEIIGGNIIDMTYFQNYLIVFSDIGEIVALNDAGTPTVIWSKAIANALLGNPDPWREMLHVSYDTFQQTLLAVNGRTRDKPIEIDMRRAQPCQYLVDPASGANTYVPRGNLIQSFDGYVLIYATDNVSGPYASDTYVDISALGTSGVYVGNPNPDDAVQVNLGRVSQTLEPRITAASNIRNQLVVSFMDVTLLGKLGTYTNPPSPAVPQHDPKFDDQMQQTGAINHRVTQNIGNDLLMCDYSGVPSLSQSLQGTIFPDRYSNLIEPAMNKHFGRLSPTTMQYKPFSVLNFRDREYMLFFPKYDEVQRTLNQDPIYLLDDFVNTDIIMLEYPNHQMEEGDKIRLIVPQSVGSLTPAQMSGDRTIVHVVNENFLLVEVGATYAVGNVQGGGSNVLVRPINDETIGYIFQLNPQMKIKRWTRYRDLNFDCGCTSLLGRVFFAKGKKIWRFGTRAEPVYADFVGDYDTTYQGSKFFAAGTKVIDPAYGVFVATVDNTSVALTFAAERQNRPGVWEEYHGEPINWQVETPWSDFGDRMAVKNISNIQLDAQGTGQFLFEAFVDNIYRDPLTLDLSPERGMAFYGKDIGGWGNGTQPWGGGRRLKEQFYYAFPFTCKTAKLRMSGSSMQALRIVAIAMQYQVGSIYR